MRNGQREGSDAGRRPLDSFISRRSQNCQSYPFRIARIQDQYRESMIATTENAYDNDVSVSSRLPIRSRGSQPLPQCLVALPHVLSLPSPFGPRSDSRIVASVGFAVLCLRFERCWCRTSSNTRYRAPPSVKRPNRGDVLCRQSRSMSRSSLRRG